MEKLQYSLLRTQQSFNYPLYLGRVLCKLKHTLVFVIQRWFFFHDTDIWCSYWQNWGLAVLESFLPADEAFTQSNIHKVVPFHRPKGRGTSLYKVVLALCLLLGRNGKFRYWAECILFSLNVEWTLSFSVLSSLCGCKLTVMLRSSEKRKAMAWKSKLSHFG